MKRSWKGDKELEEWYKAFKIRALEVIKKFKLISFSAWPYSINCIQNEIFLVENSLNLVHVQN